MKMTIEINAETIPHFYQCIKEIQKWVRQRGEVADTFDTTDYLEDDNYYGDFAVIISED